MNHPLTDLPDPILEMEAQVKTFIFISLYKNLSTPTEGFNSTYIRVWTKKLGIAYLVSLCILKGSDWNYLEEEKKHSWLFWEDSAKQENGHSCVPQEKESAISDKHPTNSYSNISTQWK